MVPPTSQERDVLQAVRVVLQNNSIQMRDVLEWKTVPIKPTLENEVVVQINGLGVWVCVHRRHDRRISKVRPA